MTFAGKKLQEIYDSGSQTLVELENKVNDRLKQTSKNHADTRKNGDDDTQTRVEERACELEGDLRSFMDQSIDRLKKVMDEEMKETEEHLALVKQDLQSLADRLKTSIVELRKTYEENVGQVCASLCDQYEGNVERATVEVDKQDYASTKRVRAHGTFVINSLQQKLDHSLWESRGEEKQYNSQLFKTFMQKANSIDTHFSTLMQKLSADFQTQFKDLESGSHLGEDELNRESQNVAQSVETFSAEVETAMNEFFRGVIEGHNKNLDNSLSSIAQDLSSVHDSTTEKLSEQTRQLSSNLVTASGEAREGLSSRCTELKTKIDEMLQSFNERMSEKVSTSASLQENLESEKDGIFTGIRKDLINIKEGFEKRLTNLITEGVARVNSIAVESEKEMQSAHERCQSQLKEDSNEARATIEQAVEEFAENLAKAKAAALEEIARSAGPGSGSAPSETPKPAASDSARPGRRMRKKDDSPDTEG